MSWLCISFVYRICIYKKKTYSKDNSLWQPLTISGLGTRWTWCWSRGRTVSKRTRIWWWFALYLLSSCMIYYFMQIIDASGLNAIAHNFWQFFVVCFPLHRAFFLPLRLETMNWVHLIETCLCDWSYDPFHYWLKGDRSIDLIFKKTQKLQHKEIKPQIIRLRIALKL